MQYTVCRSVTGCVCHVLASHSPQYVDSYDGNDILRGRGETGNWLETIPGKHGPFLNILLFLDLTCIAS